MYGRYANGRSAPAYSPASITLPWASNLRYTNTAVVTDTIAQLDVSSDITTAYMALFENLDTSEKIWLYLDAGKTERLAVIPPSAFNIIGLPALTVYAETETGETVRLYYELYDGTASSSQ